MQPPGAQLGSHNCGAGRTILCRCRRWRKHKQVLLIGLVLLHLLVTGLERKAAQREGLWVRPAAGDYVCSASTRAVLQEVRSTGRESCRSCRSSAPLPAKLLKLLVGGGYAGHRWAVAQTNHSQHAPVLVQVRQHAAMLCIIRLPQLLFRLSASPGHRAANASAARAALPRRSPEQSENAARHFSTAGT